MQNKKRAKVINMEIGEREERKAQYTITTLIHHGGI